VPKYMIQANYTAEGIRGVKKEGGTSRATNLEKLISNVGGKMESFYFAFGSEDVIVITEAPDNATVAALNLAINASGAVSTRTTVLLSPDDIDHAANLTVDYRAPGAK
jgi:uncharacterized protein with GYD domain